MVIITRIKKLTITSILCLSGLFLSITPHAHAQNTPQNTNKLVESMEFFIGTWEGKFDWPDGRRVRIKTNFKWDLNKMMISSDTWRSFEGEPYKLYFRAIQTWNYHKNVIELMAVNTEGLIVSGKRTRIDQDSVHLDYTAWTTGGDEIKGRDIFKIIDEDTYEWSFWRLTDGTYKRQEAFDPFPMHRIKN